MSNKNIPTINTSELDDLMCKRSFTGYWISDRLNDLLGRILTIIDASITDSKQNKSLKDIIKGEFIDDMSLVTEKVCEDRGIAITEDQEKQCREVNPLDVVGK